MHTPEKDKSIVTETISEVCYEERTIPGNNRSEYQALIQADAEHRRVHQKTTEKLVDMISAQEELQKAREADIARGLVEAEALHGMLAEHKTLGEKHEELSQLQAEQEKELSRTRMIRRNPLVKTVTSWPRSGRRSRGVCRGTTRSPT